MSAHKRPESLTPTDSIPRPLRDSDLMDRLAIKHSAFYKRKANGEFRFLELRPQLANSNTLYSAHLVGQWLRGEIPTEIPQQKRFFGRATPTLVAKRPVGRPRKLQSSMSHARSLREVSGEG